MMIDNAGAWPITSYTGTKVAWWLGGVLVSKDYEFIAQVSPAREVSDLQNEFIGKLVRSGKSMMLSYHDDTYENGEPIWLSAGNLDSRMCQIDGLYDLGYRLGSREQCYRPDIFNRPSVEPPEQKGSTPKGAAIAPLNPMPPPLPGPNKVRKTSPVKLGDLVNIDFEGFIGPSALEGGKSIGFELVVGSGRMIPGFEDGLIDKSAGDEFDLPVQFPTDYHAESLKGAKATFKIRLNEVFELA
ncbi:FKBP-type peptidyl-prolyl cis-trans isomerase [Ferrimonas balearica]|nr:FKBP-type peptidyl-prolyl cis-trans isomerase [Ferrimonas balearica]